MDSEVEHEYQAGSQSRLNTPCIARSVTERERSHQAVAAKPQRTRRFSVVVEANRSRSDLANLKVAAVDDEMGILRDNFLLHILGSIITGQNFSVVGQIFARD